MSRLTREQVNALQLWAIGAQGGDPWMSHVSTSTCVAMQERGLIRTQVDRTESTRLHVPTDAGYAVLAQLMTPKQRPRAKRDREAEKVADFWMGLEQRSDS